MTQALNFRPVVDVVTSHGCESRCSFCVVGSGYRGERQVSRPNSWNPRSPADVIDEIAELVGRHDVRRFHFADDNFMGSRRRGPERARELARRLRPLAIKFSFYCRVDAIRADLFDDLVAAGLRQVHLGLESGSDSTLGRLRKGQTSQDAERAICILRSLNVRIVPSYMTFEARQSISELLETLSWIEDTATHAGFSTNGSVPLPGTAMLAELRAEGLVDAAPHFKQAFQLVRFRNPGVGRVVSAIREFERRVSELVPDRDMPLLASAYHRYNDRLDVVDPAVSTRLVSMHEDFRLLELRLAMSVGEMVRGGTADSAIGRCISDAVEDWRRS